MSKKESCPACKKAVAKSAKALRCAYCIGWYHTSCLSFGDEEYDFMAQGKQGFRWFCSNCEDPVAGLLRGNDSWTGMERKITENVTTEMSSTLNKFQHEMLKMFADLERKMNISESQTQGATSQPETFANILKVALDESKKNHKNTQDTDIKINAFGESRTVRNQQVLIVKPKAGRTVDAAEISAATNNITEALKSVPVNSFRETKSGSIVVKFPTEEAKTEADNLMNSCFGADSEFSVSEPKKMLPKMTLTGIPISCSDDDIIKGIASKNKEIDELMKKGYSLTLTFAKPKNDYKVAVLKMSPEIRIAIQKADGYVYVGLSRCKAYDRFWVTQCYHCQGFGHIALKCPKKNQRPVCAFCAGDHESKVCGNKSSPHCANCSSSEVAEVPCNHFASSSDCPVMISQRQKIIENTNFTSSKNL